MGHVECWFHRNYRNADQSVFRSSRSDSLLDRMLSFAFLCPAILFLYNLTQVK